MTFRYIGSKARIVGAIASTIGRPNASSRFVDLFCGTGAVAEAAAALGWPVHLNDHLHSAATIAAARLMGRSAARFQAIGGYEVAIGVLNSLLPTQGFVWGQYSPASVRSIGFERRYFTEANAGRIDAIRAKIREWRQSEAISREEELLLVADLLGAANRVANIAGTYGCFLSKWQPIARNSLSLKPRELKKSTVPVTISVCDASEVATDENDLVYIDPPYTKRQYAAYYHLLETIALGDSPVVEGVSGLRPWKEKASEFCYKNRALPALKSLVATMDASRVLISYSSDGHIPIDSIADALREMGSVTPMCLQDVGRYRPNRVAGAGDAAVSEYLIELTKRRIRVAA